MSVLLWSAMRRPIFHIAFPVLDLKAARDFYVDILDAKVGRVRERWIDIYLFGAQLTLHEQPAQVLPAGQHGVRHFGAVLDWDDWKSLAGRLEKKGVQFKGEPSISGAGTVAEQAKLHLIDPSGNVVEVKAYRNPAIALENDDLPDGCSTIDDERYVRRALELAECAAVEGDVPIGAVLVCGELVLEAKNEKEARPDATAHAEMLLLQEAARRLGVWRLSGATLYVTKEPCVMCAGAMLAARIERVVYAARDPKGGADGGAFDILRSPKSNHRLDVTAGVLEAEAAAQLQRYFRAKRGAREREEEGIEPPAL
jgi:tRNA(Arg) A34 adenosine deaminase TadA/extradiol dioxygenase family protein